MRLVVVVLSALLAALVPSAAPGEEVAAIETGSLEPVPYDPLPASYDELPVGPPTTVAFWNDGVLCVGDHAIETRFRPTVPRSGTTVVGWQRTPLGSQWYLVRGDRLKRLPTRDYTEAPVTSGNGRWVAWLDEAHTPINDYKHDVRYRLVVFDVAEREIVEVFRNRRRVAWEDGINDLSLRSVDNRGRAFFYLGRKGARMLKPGRRPIAVSGNLDGGLEYDGWPRGIMTGKSTRNGSVGVYGTIDGAGAFSKVGVVTSPSGGVWSPTGDGFVNPDYDTDPPTFWVERVLDGSSIQLGLPDSGQLHLRVLGWESDLSVILRSRARLVRCNAVTGDCERIPA